MGLVCTAQPSHKLQSLTGGTMVSEGYSIDSSQLGCAETLRLIIDCSVSFVLLVVQKS